MWITRPAVAALLVAMTGLPALAQPIEIATLGRAPVMGQSTNPAELQYNFKRNEGIMREAGMSLGLTNEQYEQFRLALEVGKPNWVTVPRHLDAMTWASGGRVHVLHDVIIPANQKGVEVDLRSNDKVIALFLPAKCGNLSVIRRPIPHVAAIRNFPVPHVAAVTAPAPPQQTTVAAVTPLEPTPLVAPVVPIPPVAVVHHGLNLLPLAALLPFLVHGGGTSGIVTPGTGTVVGPPPCP
ncbi:MAG: hypothetical protein QOJ39_631 [Candidatus Eremiobacteraeota bacterium]|jgi:hypothetical protein|nr:hypothetical protein [Candidatus Eremiobacteraeota bacterium]MEA2718767.1 hypothetical protein [Candidatus Eremiobacteraeota bacterium]